LRERLGRQILELSFGEPAKLVLTDDVLKRPMDRVGGSVGAENLTRLGDEIQLKVEGCALDHRHTITAQLRISNCPIGTYSSNSTAPARPNDPSAALVTREGAELEQLAIELEPGADDALAVEPHVLAEPRRALASPSRPTERHGVAGLPGDAFATSYAVAFTFAALAFLSAFWAMNFSVASYASSSTICTGGDFIR
jgi:hypothetical protein